MEMLVNCKSRNPILLFKIQVLRSWGWDLAMLGGLWKSTILASIVYAAHRHLNELVRALGNKESLNGVWFSIWTTVMSRQEAMCTKVL
jgi:hypothetical protein